MAKRKVIQRKYLPTSFPIVGTCFWSFILYHFEAPGYVWGILGTLAAVAWVAIFLVVYDEEHVPPEELL